MRHRIYGRQLNRDNEHRIAMLRNLAAGLFEHGEIKTTMAKAKAVQPFVEKIITTAKQGTLHARREIESKINDRFIHAWVADRNVGDDKKDNDYFELPDQDDIKFNRYGELKKAPRLVQHIITVIAPMFSERDGGYTRIVKLDEHRLGDGTDYVLLQLVGQEEGPELPSRKSTRRSTADKRTAFAAQLRKGAKGATAVAESPAVVDETLTTAGEEPVTTAEAEESTAPEKIQEEDKSEK